MKGRQRIALRLDRGERLLGDENSMIFVNSPDIDWRQATNGSSWVGIDPEEDDDYPMVSMMRWGLFYVSMQHGGAAAKRGQRQCS